MQWSAQHIDKFSISFCRWSTWPMPLVLPTRIWLTCMLSELRCGAAGSPILLLSGTGCTPFRYTSYSVLPVPYCLASTHYVLHDFALSQYILPCMMLCCHSIVCRAGFVSIKSNHNCSKAHHLSEAGTVCAVNMLIKRLNCFINCFVSCMGSTMLLHTSCQCATGVTLSCLLIVCHPDAINCCFCFYCCCC